MTRSRRIFGEGREGNGKGEKFGGRPWGSREAMARRCGLGGAAAGARRHGGGCCAARSEIEREERDWAAGLYLALSRPDRWRGKACHVSDQRSGTLPRTHPCRAAMHDVEELFCRTLEIGTVEIGTAKSITFGEKK